MMQSKLIEKIKEEFVLTTDKSKMDVIAIHDYLSNQSYWSRNIPIDVFRRSFENSLNFGILYHGRQIGYGRIISDFATIAYLADVYVLPEFRRRGLSKWLMEEIMYYPDLQGLRRWILLTSDAHELYKKFGWKEIKSPEKYMELHNPDVYNKFS
ncbi:GNAT family N-acetyltransferase [soil metagenome]